MTTRGHKFNELKKIDEKVKQGIKLNRRDRRAEAKLKRQLKVA